MTLIFSEEKSKRQMDLFLVKICYNRTRKEKVSFLFRLVKNACLSNEENERYVFLLSFGGKEKRRTKSKVSVRLIVLFR